MNILVTGAKGFIGKNLVERLKDVQYSQDASHNIKINSIFEYSKENSLTTLEQYCASADFVFNLAGTNRTDSLDDFTEGNVNFTKRLIGLLEKNQNFCPVMQASSIQATQIGRYAGTEYGRSKSEGEEAVFSYGERTGAKVFVYRFSNVFGKWCKPNYNSVIATFCYNFANDLPITISENAPELELTYIDDLLEEMLYVLEGKESRCEYTQLEVVPVKDGRYCYVPKTHRVNLDKVVELLMLYSRQSKHLIMPSIPDDSFEKKLFSTFLSYLPEHKIRVPLKMNVDSRGSFTEILKTVDAGQFSVNISKPGVTKGEHWHHSKWEFFVVVSGKALIQERKVGLDQDGNPFPVINIEVSGDKLEIVYMLPGYTHNIINLSETDDLVTVMWANEIFDADKADTFFKHV